MKKKNHTRLDWHQNVFHIENEQKVSEDLVCWIQWRGFEGDKEEKKKEELKSLKEQEVDKKSKKNNKSKGNVKKTRRN